MVLFVIWEYTLYYLIVVELLVVGFCFYLYHRRSSNQPTKPKGTTTPFLFILILTLSLRLRAYSIARPHRRPASQLVHAPYIFIFSL